MHLYALNKSGELVSALYANRQENFECLECGGVVRRRAGLHRHAHFFHLKDASSCSLHGKGMAHIQIQAYLQKQIPQGDSALEHRFSHIGRIADCVWFSEKLVFEVQCSPISREEVLNRMRDYRSIGYETVWILHDRLYNKKNLREAEEALKSTRYYFSNMDEEGKGVIYDQFDFKKGNKRLIKLPPLPIAISSPKTAKFLYFSGDLHDLHINRFSEEYLKRISEIQKNFSPSLFERGRQGLDFWFLRPYRLLHQMLLEQACR